MAPRYSIVSGDFAEDQRADVSHFRVYLIIGRHTDKNGWCRLKQITIGERVGLSRETVNRRLKDLCLWGYVEKRKHDAAGRAYWYRTIMDRGAPPVEIDSEDESIDDGGEGQNDAASQAMRDPHSSNAENSNVTPTSHAGYNSAEAGSSSDHTTCDAADHIRCEHTASHHNDPSSTALPNESPPLPPGGGRGRAKRLNETEVALRELAAEFANLPAWRFALSEVLAPIVTQRKFVAPVVIAGLREMAKFISEHGLTAAEASGIVAKLLRERRATVKPADISDAVRHAVGNRPAPCALSGDPNLMRRWPIVIADLERRLGVEAAQQAFSTFVIDRLVLARGGQTIAYVATHDAWRKRSVDLSLSAQFRAALCAAFPNVTDFFIETRRAAA